MHDGGTLVVNTRLPVSPLAFVVVCAAAGALAVPVDALASPLSALVAGLTGVLGLRLWRWSGLPGLLKTRVSTRFERVLLPAASLGVGLTVGLLLLGAILLIEPAVPAAGARMAAAATLPIWRRLVIIYVAAVGEEVLFRLLLLSAAAGLANRLFGNSAGAPRRAVAWGATALSALAFALAHLPAWSAVGPLTPGLGLMVTTLNGVGGVAFGYVFVTRGIVAAMWAHAGADCAIQLIGPLTR